MDKGIFEPDTKRNQYDANIPQDVIIICLIQKQCTKKKKYAIQYLIQLTILLKRRTALNTNMRASHDLESYNIYPNRILIYLISI